MISRWTSSSWRRQRLVELQVGLDELLQVVFVGLHLRQRRLDLRQVFRRRAGRRQRRRLAFQQLADLGQVAGEILITLPPQVEPQRVAHRFRSGLADEGAFAGVDFDQPLLGQDFERLADDRAAHGEVFDQLALRRQLIAGPLVIPQNRRLDLPGDLLVHPRLPLHPLKHLHTSPY